MDTNTLVDLTCAACDTSELTCSECGSSRCARHLVVSAHEAVRTDLDSSTAVLRCSFPDGRLVDHPLVGNGDARQLSAWSRAWASGENRCVGCRESSGGTATQADLEPRATPTTESKPSVDDATHDARVRERLKDLGPRSHKADDYRRLRRSATRWTPLGALLTFAVVAVAAAATGGFIELRYDWIQGLDTALRSHQPPLLLERTLRDRAGFFVAALAGLVIAVPFVATRTVKARRRRNNVLLELNRTAKQIGCGEPGCQQCLVPKKAQDATLPRPAGRGALAIVVLVLVALIGLPAYFLVQRPAQAASDVGRTNLPKALQHNCSWRASDNGGYELLCRGPNVSTKHLDYVLLRLRDPERSGTLAAAFDDYRAFSHCGRELSLPNGGRYALCHTPSGRPSAVWASADGFVAAAVGKGSRRFARRSANLTSSEH